MVPPVRLELTPPASEAGTLSTELRGLATTQNIARGTANLAPLKKLSLEPRSNRTMYVNDGYRAVRTFSGRQPNFSGSNTRIATNSSSAP